MTNILRALSASGAVAGTISGMSWGNNNRGQLGLGNTTNYSSPVMIGEKDTWSQVGKGYETSIAAKSDGTLWGWGRSQVGQLGLGNTTSYSSPVQVGALTTWLKPIMGYGTTFSTKTDGTLWAWGNNNSGQLGLGDKTNRSSPVQVGSLTTWSMVGAGQYNGMAVKTDGTLWAWGSNGSGQLGQGDVTGRSSPVQVGALTTWANVTGGGEFAIAAKTDNTIWTWGENGLGELGLGDTSRRSSPVQVGSLTTWSDDANKIACTGNSTWAVKTDGTLWGWGENSKGELGLGNTTAYSSPVQVGSLTNWSRVYGFPWVAKEHFVAIKTDGTLWACGDNSSGQLGQGNTTAYSSPVQVGSLTTWLEADAGYGANTALEGPA